MKTRTTVGTRQGEISAVGSGAEARLVLNLVKVNQNSDREGLKDDE